MKRRFRLITCSAVILASTVLVLPIDAASAAVVGPRLEQPLGAHPTDAHRSYAVSSSFSQPSNSPAQLIRIPVPAGVQPTSVRGRLTFDSAAIGTVVVMAHGVDVQRIQKRASDLSARITVALTPEDVVGGYVQFSLEYLTNGVTDPQQFCLVPTSGTVQLSRIAITFTGQEADPTTLARFFGPAVTAVSIEVPQGASRSVEAAALAAASAVAHRYSRGVQITVTEPSNASRAADVKQTGGRLVVLRPTSGPVRASIDSVGGTHRLTLSGSPNGLVAAATALGSPYLTLANVSNASSLHASGHAVPASNLSFADLGQPAPTVQGLGQSQFSVGVSQSNFNAAVKSMTVHLVGQHTAIPSSISASLQYFWNGQLVASELLGATTLIDKKLRIPSTQMAANNTLLVQLDAVPSKYVDGSGAGTSGRGFNCQGVASFLPIIVSFDGKASTFAAETGTSSDPGFARFPQVLGNVLTVALGDTSADTLSNAAGLISELQFANASQLAVEAVDPSTLINSSAPGLLVGATPQQMNQLGAPLRMAEFRSINQGDRNFGVGVDRAFAAMEAFNQNGRDILTLSSWAANGDSATARTLEANLIHSLTHSAYGWSALYDNLEVLQPQDTAGVLVSSNDLVPQSAVVTGFNSYVYWIVAFVGLVVVMWLLQFGSRRRLRRRAIAMVDAQVADQAGSDEAP